MKKSISIILYVLLSCFLILGIVARVNHLETLSFGAFTVGLITCLPFSHKKGQKTFTSNICMMLLLGCMFIVSLCV